MDSKIRKVLTVMVFTVMAAFVFAVARNINAEENTSDIFVMPVSAGTTITIYEQTSQIYTHTYPVSILMTTGGTFSTTANEYYTVISDGTYLTIRSYRDTWLSGHAVGNNIVAVRLDGVHGYPSGLWASSVLDYTLGHNGIAESRFNALGDDSIRGPYIDFYATLLGDQDSEIVLGFSVPKMTAPELQTKIVEAKTKIIELTNQLIQILKERITEIKIEILNLQSR